MAEFKVALAQMRVIPGRPLKNLEKMLTLIQQAKDKGANMVAFPEMCVGGYLLGDKWTNEEFCENLMFFNENLREASKDIVLAYGNIFVDKELNERTNTTFHPNKDGRTRKYNAVYVFQDGRPAVRVNETNLLPAGIQPKTLLPTYRIFDDQRYFFSTEDLAKEFNIPLETLLQPFLIKTKDGIKKIGFEACEDLWCEDYRKNLRALNPTKILVNNGAEMIVNVSASPWTFGKNAARDRRVLFLKEDMDKEFVPFFYVNCTGVQNNGKNIVTFDGGSTVYNNQGLPIIFSRESNKEELILVDQKDLERKPKLRKEKSKIEQKYEAVIQGMCGLKDIWGTNQDPRVIIGLSGGIDSCLVAALSTIAFGKEKVMGVNMPTKYNSQKTKDAAKLLADRLGIKYGVIPIEDIVQANTSAIDKLDLDLSGKLLTEFNLENVQAKIRGTSILSNLAAKYGAIFTNNGNKLETAIGYATLYGDVGGAIAPIADLTKIEIVEMSKFMNKKVFKREVIPSILFPDELWRFNDNQIQPTAELKNKQIDPMKFVYHCALVDAFTDYKKKSATEVMQWYVDGVLHKRIDDYLRDILHKDIGLNLMKRWNIDNPQEFVRDLEWFDSLFQKSIFKRIQGPPIIITDKTSFGFDLRESMLPYEPTQKQLELRNFILTKMKNYEPK